MKYKSTPKDKQNEGDFSDGGRRVPNPPGFRCRSPDAGCRSGLSPASLHTCTRRADMAPPGTQRRPNCFSSVGQWRRMSFPFISIRFNTRGAAELMEPKTKTLLVHPSWICSLNPIIFTVCLQFSSGSVSAATAEGPNFPNQRGLMLNQVWNHTWPNSRENQRQTSGGMMQFKILHEPRMWSKLLVNPPCKAKRSVNTKIIFASSESRRQGDLQHQAE